MDYSVEKEALKNKVILVSGAGDGIGKQAALSFAKYGATLILLGRTKSKLEKTCNEIISLGGTQPTIIPLDMLKAEKEDYLQIAESLKQQFDHLDGVLHNAGLLGTITPLEEIDIKVFDDAMSVNVRAGLLLTQVLLPLLRESSDARVVFTSSTVGHIGRALWGTYAISKFATEGMMQVLADELKDTHIRVNAINPGGTRTSMRAQAFPSEDPNTLKTPEDIMPLYLYLMAPEGKDIHGQCIDAQPKK